MGSEELESLSRFSKLLKELAEAHDEEVAKLRAEVAELAPGLRPFPRMSPPVLAIERGDSRGDGGLLREDCSFASKPSNESNLEPEQTFEPSEGKPDTLEGIPEHTEGKPTILVSSAAGLAQRLKKSLSADQNEDDWGTADVSVSVSNPAVEAQRAFYQRWSSVFLSNQFEFGIAVLLVVNMLLMAAQLQYHGLKVGFEMGYPRYDLPAQDAWPNVEGVFVGGDIAFALVFTIEMLVRLGYVRCEYFRHWLNWIDILVVGSSWAELFAAALPISPTFLRMLRLGKLLRALRVVKMSRVLESLQLLLKCIHASLRILFWSLVLLMIIQCSAGMTISYMVSDFMVDPGNDAEARFAVFRYYGTFSKTLLTMFEVLFANWAPPCRVLIDNVSEIYAMVFIVYRCFVGFAVLNVVNAVFVQSTMKVAQADDEFIARERLRSQEVYRQKVAQLFRRVDTSGDGYLDVAEFNRLLLSPKLQVCLSQLEIETTDLMGLFRMLDDGDGEISLQEFEAGIMKIKGQARSFDLHQLDKAIQKLSTKVDLVLSHSPHTRDLMKVRKVRSHASAGPTSPGTLGSPAFMT